MARANQSRKDAGLREWFDHDDADPVTAGLTKLKAPTPEGVSLRERLYDVLELKNTEFNAHGIELNQRYTSSAVQPDPTLGEEEWPRHPELYLQATTRPGSKLPHAWLVDARGRRTSNLHVTGKGQMTLLIGPAGAAWADAADKLDLPFLKTVVIGQPGALYLYGYWQQIRDIPEAGALLVRPDGYIAWRHNHAVGTSTRPPASSRTRCAPSSTASTATAHPTPAAPTQAAVSSTPPGPSTSPSPRPPLPRDRLHPTKQEHHRVFPADHLRDLRRDDRRDPSAVHERLELPEPGRVLPGVPPGGPYRTRYLHAGDVSKPVLLFLHGITGHGEAYVRNCCTRRALLRVGD